MNIRKKLLFGVVFIGLFVYNVSKKKIGPCSPELEHLLNQES